MLLVQGVVVNVGCMNASSATDQYVTVTAENTWFAPDAAPNIYGELKLDYRNLSI